MTSVRRKFAALALLSLVPATAFANAGIPMLALAWPLHWLSLLPIVALEAAIVSRAVGMPYRRLVWPVAKANLVSTFVGVPLAWAAMLVLQFLVAYGVYFVSPETVSKSVPLPLFPFMVAWLGDVRAWNVYAAYVVLAIPLCIASIIIERRVLANAFPSCDVAMLRSATRNANLVSYALMTAAAVAYPLLA